MSLSLHGWLERYNSYKEQFDLAIVKLAFHQSKKQFNGCMRLIIQNDLPINVIRYCLVLFCLPSACVSLFAVTEQQLDEFNELIQIKILTSRIAIHLDVNILIWISSLNSSSYCLLTGLDPAETFNDPSQLFLSTIERILNKWNRLNDPQELIKISWNEGCVWRLLRCQKSSLISMK